MTSKLFSGNRSDIASVLVLIIFLLVLIRFPRFIPFQTGKFLSITLSICLILFKMMPGFMDKIQLIRVVRRNILGKFLPFIVILSVSFFMIPHLNAVFYEVDRPASLINLSYYTIGNILPVSDSGGYLSSIYSFLDYGIVHSVSIFRPLGTLYAAVVFLLCGSDLFVFHIYNSVLFILAISMVTYHVIKYMGMFAAFLSMVLLCGYYSGIQGYVVTEIPGGQFGLISILCIMDGLYTGGAKKYYIGLLLLCLAMQIRAGEMFFPLFLILYSTWRFRKHRFGWTRHMIVGISLMVFTYMATPIQSMIFREKSNVVSNVSAQLYQIFTKADSWSVYYTIPVPKEYQSFYESSKYRNDYIINVIKQDPLKFFRNYADLVLTNLNRPGSLFFMWYPKRKHPYAIILLVFFFLTPIFFRQQAYVKLYYRILILYVLSVVLSSPILLETSIRNHAATMYLTFGVFILGVLSCLRWIVGSMKLLIGYNYSINHYEYNAISYSGISTGTFYFTVACIIMILFGPVVVDRLRTSRNLPVISLDEKPVEGKSLLLLSTNPSTYVRIFPNDNFIIQNPQDIPRKKYANTSILMSFTAQHPIDTTSFVFNGLNHLNFKDDQMSCPTIIIPAHLFKGKNPEELDYVLCDFQTKSDGYSYYLMVDSIRKVIRQE